MAEWLRRLIRNQLEAIPQEFESLCCRVFIFFSFYVWYSEKCILLSTYHLLIGARGATDSASDFESGGCGFESRRACFSVNPLLWAVGLVVWFSLWVREVAGSIPARPLCLFFHWFCADILKKKIWRFDFGIPTSWVLSSAVEHGIADPAVAGSIPAAPFFWA